MSTILLKCGLVSFAFYDIILRLFPYINVISSNTRIAKSYIGMWVALALGLTAIYSGQVRKCRNFWLLLFIGFIPLSIHLAPKFPVILNGIDSTNYWVWYPFLKIICYFLMFIYVQSLNINRKSFISLLNIMVWCGFVMACYVLLQYYGWDQFFYTKTGGQFDFVTKPSVVGTLGNSTLVSPFIAMIIPLALYLPRITAYRFWIPGYVIIPVLIGAVLVCQSEIATGAMIASIIIYSLLRARLKAFLTIFIIGCLIFTGGSVYKYKNPAEFKIKTSNILNDNGRFNVWKEAVVTLKDEEFGEKNINRGKFPFTGTGIGSFSILWKPMLKTIFAQAHNEYLEIMCTLGFGGLFLFIMALLYFFRDIFRAIWNEFNVPEVSALTASFICIALVASGSFVWQLSPHIEYTVVISGLLSNGNLTKEELNV